MNISSRISGNNDKPLDESGLTNTAFPKSGFNMLYIKDTLTEFPGNKFRDNPLKETLFMAAVFAVYYLSGKLGLTLAFENASATAVWAPTGIAITAILLRGYYVWPAILAGAFLINITTTGNIPTSVLIALGNTGEGLLGAYLVNKYAGGKFAFENTANIFRFALYAGLLSTMLSATVGVTSLALWGYAEWSSYLSVWLTWWIGDAVGAFLIVPFLILWFQKKKFRLETKNVIELIVVFVLLAAVAAIEFAPVSFVATEHYPVNYLLLPPLVWIAFRFDKRFVAAAVFALSAVAIWGTINNYGPFVVSSQNDSLLFLQAFISIATIMTIAFASVVEQHNETLKLVHSEKLASLGRFSAGIAHEIRNPLANISSLAQLLNRKNTDPDIKKHLGYIQENSNIANSIIKDLLNIASHNNIVFKKSDIAAIIEDTCSLAEARCEKNKISLVRKVHKDLGKLSMNEEKIQAAFLNLISNAIDAMPGGGTLTVAARQDSSSDEIIITFEDTGTGIAENNRDKILEPFFTTKHDGTGLGLNLAHQVIQAHSGNLNFESTAGKGTKFIIRLPVLTQKNI
jgi:signal transduction histidine kinase